MNTIEQLAKELTDMYGTVEEARDAAGYLYTDAMRTESDEWMKTWKAVFGQLEEMIAGTR